MGLRRLLQLAGLITGVLVTGATGVIVSTAASGTTNTFSFVFGDAFVTDPLGTTLVGVDVERGNLLFRQLPPHGPPVVQQNGTELHLFVESPSGFSGGCWIIADTDFVVARQLQGATLHTTVPPDSNCPGVPLPQGAAAGMLSPRSLGEGGGLSGPLTIDVTWTPDGNSADGVGNSSTRCTPQATITGHSAGTEVEATVSLSVSGLAGPLTGPSGVIQEVTDTQTIVGTPPDICGFGKG